MRRIILIGLFSLITLLHAVYLREGWESGRLYTNNWSLDPVCENWQIQNAAGYQLRFNGYPANQDYSYALVSKSFDLSGVNSLSLQFSCQGLLSEACDTEKMALEYKTGSNPWTQFALLEAELLDPVSPLQTYNFSLDSAVGQPSLQLRFRVFGQNSGHLIRWALDDILLCDQAYLPPAIISGTITDNLSEPIAGAWITDGRDHARSDANGQYQLLVFPSASCSLKVKAFGYDDSLRIVGNLASGIGYSESFVMATESGYLDPYHLAVSADYAPDGPQLAVYWQRVNETPDDSILELGYDQLPALYFYRPFMINECEYLLSRFSSVMELGIGAIKLALQSSRATNVEIVGFYELDGHPDLNNPVFGSELNFLYEPTVPAYPEWVQVPLYLSVPPNTPVYFGVKFQPGEFYSLGMGSTADHPSWYCVDGSEPWDTLTGEAVMLRLVGQEFEPWESRSFSGYNLYHNHVKLNSQPLSQSYLQIPEPAWGEHLFYVTAVYGEHESNPSNSVSVEIAALQIGNVSFMIPEEQAPYLSILAEAYNIRGGLSHLELLKDGVLLHTFTDISPSPYKFSGVYQDYQLLLDAPADYSLVAHYQDGSSLASNSFVYRLLLPPLALQANGVSEGVQLSWTAPHLPQRELLGYKLERFEQGEIIAIPGLQTAPNYLDTEVVAGTVYGYHVAAVYSDGEVWSEEVQVVAGAPVLHPVTGLTAASSPEGVRLAWQRPADGKYIISKDTSGLSEAFGEGVELCAAVRFDPSDLTQARQKEFVCLAFIPASGSTYTINVYNCGGAEEFLVNSILVEDPVPGAWNAVEFFGMLFDDPMVSYRIEISGIGGLWMDDSNEAHQNANLVYVDGAWSNLQNAFGLSHNWKLRLKVKDPDVVIPVQRGLYPDLQQYYIIRNQMQVGSISEFDTCFLDSDPAPGTLVYQIAAVYDMGVSELSSPVEINPSSNADWLAPESLVLQPNYPNPFNPSTTLAFYLPKTGEASLEIYNLKGQKVKTLLKGMITAGKHSLVWNGKDESGQAVASGVYFGILKSDEERKSTKMILAK